MEKEKIIKSHDGKNIYGTFSRSLKKTKNLIIFVHGFIGNSNEHIFFNGAKLFNNKGFDTYRFNLYAGDGKNTRNFSDTKISLHGVDINTVIKNFRNKYEHIYLIGHSYGGTALLFTEQSMVDGYIFWDASLIDSDKENKWWSGKFNLNLNSYILDCGMETLIGKNFVEELMNFPSCVELIKKINKPILLVAAGKKGNLKAGKEYYKHANRPKSLVNIKSADHNFNNWNDEETLIRITYDWLITIETNK